MPIHLTHDELVDEGAFGRVYRLGNHAIKVFKRNTATRCDADIIKIRDSEYRALEIANNDPELSNHVPDLIGFVEIERISGVDGEDLSSDYFLDACIEMSFVEGHAKKLGIRARSHHVVGPIVSRLNAAGIKYTEDLSIFWGSSEEAFILIDIATESPPEPNDIGLVLPEGDPFND